MRVVSRESGTAWRIFLPDEVRFSENVYSTETLDELTRRYTFSDSPNLKTATHEGAKFKLGKYTVNGETIAIHEIGIFRDGLSAACRTTEQADLIMDDLLQWGQNRFNIETPSRYTARYLSAVVVDFAKPLSSAIKGFTKIQKAMGDALKAALGESMNADVVKLSFAPDPATFPANFGAVELTLDRRKGTPFEINRHFSVAPLTTAAHVSLLESIETAFSEGDD